jgi:hypothetical protein
MKCKTKKLGSPSPKWAKGDLNKHLSIYLSMILRVSLSKSKVSKRSGFWVSRKIKTRIDRVFWLNLYLFKSSELISRKNWPPGPEEAIPRAIQGNRSYHGITDQFNVSNGSVSNVIKLFTALSGVQHRFTTKKLQIATPKQDKWLVWLSRNGSHSDPVELKTDLQTKNMVSANAITALRRLRVHMPVTRRQNI